MGFLEFLKPKKDVKQVKRELSQKIKTLKGEEGKTLKKIVDEENNRDEFFEIMFTLSYEKNKTKKQQLLKKAKLLAEKIPEFAGWPKSNKFWDVEALAWIVNIPKQVREDIKKQINKRIPKGNNLSLGCGSYPYVNNSVLVDFSEEMLNTAPPKYKDKVLFDLNKGNLPFRSFSFDSVTLVFIANYIKDLRYVLREVKRILKEEGKVVIVQSAKPIAHFYKMKEKKAWKPKEIENILKKLKLQTMSYEHKIGRTKLIFTEAMKND